jgi:predicted metalloprotease
MKWEGHERSSNIEDRRGRGGGGLGGLPIGGRGIGLGTVAVAVVAGLIFGVNPLAILGLMSGDAPVAQQQQQRVPTGQPAESDPAAAFVATVLRDTEQVWGQQFQAAGVRYREPVLVLFRGATPTACGTGQAAMGPFYCPGDTRVYIDLDFLDAMQRRLGAQGDFARAYVIAHEVAHHVQHITGHLGGGAERAGVSRAEANARSVRTELQADCLAGVWAHHSQRSKGWLEQGDIEEALNAASQIGDDTLQKRSGGAVVPESFTHGSSAQRVAAFKLGYEAGSPQRCGLGARQP